MPCLHAHTTADQSRQESLKALKKTLFLVILFMNIELFFGLWANSLALITDALHMFTDAGAICLSIFAFWISKKPASHKMSFGYHRAEIVAALISGLSTWALSGWLIYEAIARLKSPPEVEGPMVLGVACFGFISNFIMMWILHKKQKESLNVRGAYIHIFGDLLGSLGVIIAGLMLMVFKWNAIDPLITLLFSVIVIHSAWLLIKDSLHVLMEGTPKNTCVQTIEKALLELKSVNSLHDLHVWCLTQNHINLSAHLISENPDQALLEAQQLLKEKFEIHHATLQIEPPSGFECHGCHFQTQ